MKTILRTILPFVFLGGLVFHFQDRIPYLQPGACDEPIPYNLGTFASEFDISEEYFLSAIKDAESLWEKSAGKDLFVHAPEDDSYNVLKINLVYDYRQEATSRLSKLGIEVEDTRESYDSLKSKYERLKDEYEKERRAFSARVGAFNKRNDAYEKEVDSWNEKGGAPEEDYERLEKERETLEAEASQLEKVQARVNKMVEDINAMVVGLNRLAGKLNLTVDRYNAINETRGESFEEGVFESEGTRRKIDIYEFENREKLLRVLAHELGHALSLDHIPDPNAIMYEFNQGTKAVVTEADLKELALKCERK